MTLDEFLQELSARRGVHRKIMLVTRYWRQIQGLPADEQRQVALALGSKAAWNRLEKLFAKDGTLSDGELAVKRTLDRVGRADPDGLRKLASNARSGNYGDLSRDLVDLVVEAVDEEADYSAETGGASEDTAIDDEAAPLHAAEPIDEPAATDEAVSGEEAPDERPAAEGGRADEIPDVVEAPHAAAVATRSPPLRETVAEAAAPPSEVIAESAPPPSDSGAGTGAAGFPATSAAEKLGLLRELRDDPGFGARLGRSGRAQLLARLSPGWAARRALSELIRGGAIDGLDEALRLTGALHSDVQKAWCLGDLVQHWPLDETALERILRVAPSPAAISRLRRRHARRHSLR